jgi:outer membrane protein TolC
MNVRCTKIFIFLTLFSTVWKPYATAQLPADSLFLFTPEQLLTIVAANHPVARQAQLLTDQAQAEVMRARGMFDPKLYGDWERKYFGGKSYFDVGEYGLKVPTWYGVEVKMAYQHARGILLNPEDALPEAGQAMLGFELNLLRGLLLDDRRAALARAKVARQTNEQGRQAMLNDLYFEALKAYWSWAWEYAQLDILRQALQVAGQRLTGIRESYTYGDLPAIDTVEALIQVQNRQLELTDATNSFVNATFQLSTFLWDTDGAPIILAPDSVRAVAVGDLAVGQADFPERENLLLMLQKEHPELLRYRNQLAELDIERRWKLEQFKPELRLQYNFLADGLDFSRPAEDAWLESALLENYKLGLQFGFPLFLRKERGSLQLTKLKQLETQLKLDQKSQELVNKLSGYLQSIQALQSQILTAEAMVANYRSLLDAENGKFQVGESSLFLINSRENKLIEGQQKLLKLKTELMKTQAALRWVAGTLHRD